MLGHKGVDTVAPTVIGSSIVAQKSATGLALPGTANINLLMGIDPASNDLSALTSKNPFVLLVLQDSTGKYTQLTSANPLAANYMPFAPDVLNKATGTGGIAKRAPMLLSVTDVKALYLPASANWALYGFGNRALASKPAVPVSAVNAFPRDFVGLETVDGKPMSFWTNDGATFADMALSMAGSQVGVATDLTTTAATAGSTLSTIGTANMVKGAQGLAWSNQDGAANGATGTLGHLYVAQATGVFAPDATDLLVEDGRCQGLTALEIRSGEMKQFQAGAVIIAAGGGGKMFPFTTNGNIKTGDGMALAYRAGTPLKDMEFVQYHPTGLRITVSSSPRVVAAKAAYCLTRMAAAICRTTAWGQKPRLASRC